MRRIVVTGCASGIGAACARILKSRSAVHITGLDVATPSGSDIDAFVAIDLADPASIARAVGAIQGPFDALLNVAGLPPRPGREAGVLAVNFIGTRNFTHRMLPQLAPGASIVNMASRAGHRWPAGIEQVKRLLALADDADLAGFVAAERIDTVRAYDLSKEAMIVWTMAATEPLIARGLRMSSVSPGAVDTRLFVDFVAAFGPGVERNVARAGRPGRPEEAAEVAVWLASPESGWIKGADICVDGGIGAFTSADRLGLAPWPPS